MLFSWAWSSPPPLEDALCVERGEVPEKLCVPVFPDAPHPVAPGQGGEQTAHAFRVCGRVQEKKFWTGRVSTCSIRDFTLF